MFEIQRQIELDAGHRVPYHASKCKHLHGHRFKVIAHVQADDTVRADPRRADSGMITDFGVIKQVLMEEIHDKFDHRFMLWEHDPILKDLVFVEEDYSPQLSTFARTRFAKEFGIITVPCIPTAEELARYWGYLVEPRLHGSLDNGSYWFSALEVWETPNSMALYTVQK